MPKKAVARPPRSPRSPRPIRLPRSVKRLFPQVTSAVDADAPVEVSVNAKDCRDAQKLNPTECALARAARRELHAEGVIIGMTSSYIINGKTALRFATPVSVQREIVSFDRNQDFAPGDYYLTPKAPTNKLGHGPRPKRPDHGSHKNARRKLHHSARVRVLSKGSA
jgi:hypothetical protein